MEELLPEEHMEEGQCPLCGEKAEMGPWPDEIEDDGTPFTVIADKDVNCKSCRKYTLGEPLAALKADYGSRLHLISGFTRDHWDRTGERLRLTRDYLDKHLAQEPTPSQCIEKLLLHLRRKSEPEGFGAEVELHTQRDKAVAFARSRKEFKNFIDELVKDGHATEVESKRGPDIVVLKLTPKGCDRAKELDPSGGEPGRPAD